MISCKFLLLCRRFWIQFKSPSLAGYYPVWVCYTNPGLHCELSSNENLIVRTLGCYFVLPGLKGIIGVPTVPPHRAKGFLQDSHLMSFDGRMASEAKGTETSLTGCCGGFPLPLGNEEHLLGWALHVAESL